MSYTDKLLAMASCFAGEVAERCGMEVAGEDEAIVRDRVGADEFMEGC